MPTSLLGCGPGVSWLPLHATDVANVSEVGSRCGQSIAQMVFSFGSVLAHAQQDGHDENSLRCVVSLGGPWTACMCFDGTSPQVVQHCQQNPHGWSAGTKTTVSRLGPEFQFSVWTCQHRPIAKGCLEGKLVRGDLMVQQ